MLLLLPPSETKRDGGQEPALALEGLSFGSLTSVRRALVDALVDLSADREATMRALKLGPRQVVEVERVRRLLTAPTMPALDRYTGVLFDALDASTLDDAAREYAGRHVAVHSALFGIVGALDLIPPYRLSHDSRLPGLRLKAVWREPIREELAARTGLIVDLRSEGYAELGPLPDRADTAYVRVVSVAPDGRRRALNHFNKAAKGRLVRALVQSRPDALEDVGDLMAWAGAHGLELSAVDTGRKRAWNELELVA